MQTDLSEKTRRALEIMRAAIEREKNKKRMRYSHGFCEKPATHDELQESIDRAYRANNDFDESKANGG